MNQVPRTRPAGVWSWKLAAGFGQSDFQMVKANSSPAIDASGETARGHVRETNEDAYLLATLDRSMRVEQTSLPSSDLTWLTAGSGGVLLVVADGMGGQGGGDVASRVAVRAIADYVCSVMPWAARHASEAPASSRATIPGVREQLSTALTTGDTQVRNAAHLPGGSPHMGTTLTMAYVLWPRLYVAHVGDSRCYLFRDGALARLTTDHTVAEQMREQGFDPLEASSPLHHVLWNSLGASQDGVVPEIRRALLHEGDVVLLCTDGLTKHVSEEDVIELLNGDPTIGAEKLTKALVNLACERGGTDNVTVVAARIGDPPAQEE